MLHHHEYCTLYSIQEMAYSHKYHIDITMHYLFNLRPLVMDGDEKPTKRVTREQKAVSYVCTYTTLLLNYITCNTVLHFIIANPDICTNFM